MLNKEEIQLISDQNGYLPDGTKKACLTIRHFVQVNEEINGPMSDRVADALRLIISASFDKPDEVPELYHCDNDCSHISDILRPGEMHLSPSSTIRCPHFADESNI